MSALRQIRSFPQGAEKRALRLKLGYQRCGPPVRDTSSPSRIHASPHISTRQYARLVHRWVKSIGLDSTSYGTHSMRRTKAAQIYRKTGNLRAVQLLLGHTKLESTVRYLGIEMDDALNMAEQIEL
jgi:integrase